MTDIQNLSDAYIIGQENFDSWSVGFDIDGYLKVLPHPTEVVVYKDPFLLWQQDHANYKDGIFVSEGADGSYYSSWGPEEVLEVTLDMSVLEEIVVDGFGIIEEGDHFIDWLGKATPYDIFRAYNSRIPGPMLITEPGDIIKITLNNNLNEITNLHTHGLHVSPVGNGDNVLITVAPGDSWDIEIEIPEDHFIGPDWYHPHYHGETNEQVASGLGGYLLINPPYDLPDLDKYDPVENPAFFMAIQSLGIQQEYRYPSPDDPLNQSPLGVFVPAGTPLLQSTVFDFQAEYALENIFSPIPDTNLFEVNIDGTDPDSPFPFITGLIYGTIDQNGKGRFNSDPSVFGLTGFESGFVALEDGNGNRIYGTDDASSQVNFFTSTVDASGEVILTGGEGLFSGVIGTLSLSEDGIFNPDPTQPYIADLTVAASFTVPRPIDTYDEGTVKYSLAEAPFVGYNAKPVFYNPEQPQGFPVPGPNFSSAYGEGGLAEPVENVIHTVNGQYNPTIETTTGQWNLFSFANMTVNSFHVIQLYKEEADGSLSLQDMILTAIDGDAAGVVEGIRRDVTESPILNPGSRLSLQNWFEEPGKYYFIANATEELLGDKAPLLTKDQGFKDGHLIWGSQVLATVDVTGDPTPTGPFPEPYDVLIQQSDEINALVDAALAGDVTQERTFEWSANIGGALIEGRFPDDTEVSTFEGTYRINGEYFATEGLGMPPLTMPMLGTNEIWNLRNISGISNELYAELGIDLPLLEWHPFHIHQNDFVVLEINGIPVEDIEQNYLARVLSDTIALSPSYTPGSATPENPYGTPEVNGLPSEVKILMEFADYPGAYVNHCHILFHEDAGMMAVVRVILNTDSTWLGLPDVDNGQVRFSLASRATETFTMNPYGYGYAGGVQVGIGDINYVAKPEQNTNVTDNVTDIAVVQERLTATDQKFVVKVFNGTDTNQQLAEISPFQNLVPSLQQQTAIAVGDVNGDGFGDIVVGIGGDRAPVIEIYSGKDYQLMATLAPFHHGGFTGTINIATGDVNGDNFMDIIVGQGAGGHGMVEIYNGKAIYDLMQSGTINSLSPTGLAHETSLLSEPFHPYGDNYMGAVEVTSGYILSRPETPTDQPVQTSHANITTLAVDQGQLSGDQGNIQVWTYMGGHGGHGGHSGHSAAGSVADSEPMPEIRLDKEISTPSEVVKLMGTFADIPGGLRGEPVLYAELADGTNQYIYLDKNTGAESFIEVSHQGTDISTSVTQFVPIDPEDSLGQLKYNLDNVANRTTTQTNQDALNQTDALFDNLVGLYRVANADGAVFDIFDANGNGSTTDLLNPGESGYANAALNQVASNVLLQLGSLGDVNKNTTANEFGDVLVNGGQTYAPFVIAHGGALVPQGGTLQDGLTAFLAQNPANTGATLDNFLSHAVAYFGFGSANPDSSEHLKSYGNNTFGFEDLPGNLGVSDFDFNDGVFQFAFLS